MITIGKINLNNYEKGYYNKRFLGGDYSCDVVLHYPEEHLAIAIFHFSSFLNQEIIVGNGFWKGYVVELDLAFGDSIYRTSLIENFANKIRVEYATSTFTSWSEDLGSQSVYGIRELTLDAQYLTLATADKYRAEKLREIGWPEPRYIGRNTTSDKVTLSVTGIGHFFKLNYVEVPSMSYAINISDAVSNILTAGLPSYNKAIQSNTEQVVGPAADNPVEYLQQMTTFSPNPRERYRIYLRDNTIYANFVSSDNATVIGDYNLPYNVDPGFYKVSFSSMMRSFFPAINNSLFIDNIRVDFTPDNDLTVSYGDHNTIDESIIFEQYYNLNRQEFIDNREEEHLKKKLEEEERKRKAKEKKKKDDEDE